MKRTVKRALRGSRQARTRPSPKVRRPEPGSQDAPRAPEDFPIVAVGASAGGLEAMTELLSSIPSDSGIAIVLLQHLDPSRASILGELLARASSMPVHEIRTGLRLEASHVYVAPAASRIDLDGESFVLTPLDKGHGRDLPIDRLFERLAALHGSRVAGVILSGTLSDGARGLRAVKAAGGLTFAQDELSAKFPDMPRAAAATGSVDFVLPPKGIAAHLVTMARHTLARGEPPEVGAQAAYQRILAMLRVASGVSFAHYRQTTVRRRILRRLVLNRIHDLSEYAAFLREHPEEVVAAYEDILIRVTSFFRDPETFDALKEKVFPAFLREQRHEPIRVWVPGCATGEEAYSLAIALLEFLPVAEGLRIQIFGTDVSEKAIGKARAGIYPEDTFTTMSPERKRRFFTRVTGGYQIARQVRDLCIFARQNVIEDPPFSNIDLVSCRNLLIYLETVLQSRVVGLFHYALKPSGFLLLGGSEALGDFDDQFTPLDRSHRIFVKHAIPTRAFSGVPGRTRPAEAGPLRADAGLGRVATTLELQRRADQLVLHEYAPPGVLVDDAFNVMQFRGRTGPYLELASGIASLNVLKMAREGLMAELRSALLKARKTGRGVRAEGLSIREDGNLHETAIDVTPVRDELSGTRCFLVLFEAAPPRRGAPPKSKPALRPREPVPQRSPSGIRRELAETKEYLQSVIEQLQGSNEELRSANEEILSSNEELQSTNEELETTKEELQSTNEELTVLNEELNTRNVLLSRSLEEVEKGRDFAESILETMREPLAVLDDGWRLKSFNRAFQEMFRTASESLRGVSLFELLEWRDHAAQLREHLDAIAGTPMVITDFPLELVVAGVTRKFMVNASRVRRGPLILLALDDVTERAHLEEELRQVQRLESIGTLAGGVAHDFNNILNIILAYTGLARRLSGDPEKRDASLAAVEGAVKRGSAVVRQLLTFARRSAAANAPIQLNDLVGELVSMLRETFPKSIEIETYLEPGMPTVSVDSDQIHQVLLNVCVNARDAMPEGGQLQITTRLLPGALVRRQYPEAQALWYAALGISDTGLGMDEETRRHVFEPFFTTKPMGTGSGLGLAVAYGVVRAHLGFVDIESDREKGTTVRLLLPVEKIEAKPAAAAAPAERKTSGSETILLVEDEEPLRDAVKQLLEEEGYSVLTAGDGIEALRTFAERPDLKMVVLDLGLPHVSGLETLERMKAMNPAVRCVVVSGNLDSERRTELHKAGVLVTLRKPYQTSELFGAIRRALDSPGRQETAPA